MQQNNTVASMGTKMEHKSILIQILYMAISVSIAYLGRHFITLSDLKDLTSTLQNVSAAVFTLAGIWVAYSYPEAIARFTNPKKFSLIKGTEQTQRIRSLVLTIFFIRFCVGRGCFVQLTLSIHPTPL